MGYVLGGAMLCFVQEGVRANAPLGAAVWWVQLVVVQELSFEREQGEVSLLDECPARKVWKFLMSWIVTGCLVVDKADCPSFLVQSTQTSPIEVPFPWKCSTQIDRAVVLREGSQLKPGLAHKVSHRSPCSDFHVWSIVGKATPAMEAEVQQLHTSVAVRAKLHCLQTCVSHADLKTIVCLNDALRRLITSLAGKQHEEGAVFLMPSRRLVVCLRTLKAVKVGFFLAAAGRAKCPALGVSRRSQCPESTTRGLVVSCHHRWHCRCRAPFSSAGFKLFLEERAAGTGSFPAAKQGRVWY
ncbi:hypothetical protein Anapl_01970 [Anas platyrhynchos]|uniref:Uncharacterized protein n=1 Tax=Anas platyrhynchos TaxID=8839 RepID=R0M4E3_ANAPL|nr:hypothetical protein Anapl_01970 [Anas platyrhynchos]